MSVPARSYRHPGAWIWLAFLALLPRVLLPAGTMPQLGAGLDVPLALCTSSGLEFRSVPALPVAPTDDPAPHSGHDCPFGAVSASAIPVSAVVPVVFAAAFATLLLPAVAQAASPARPSAHRARAPPLAHS